MPNSNKPHETAADCKDAAGKLAGRADVLLAEGEGMIMSNVDGGRGIALVGIGRALLAINCNLERLANPLVSVRLVGEPPDHDWDADGLCTRCKQARYNEPPCPAPPDPASVERRIYDWRSAACGDEAEGHTELLCDAEGALAAYRERFGPLGTAVEVHALEEQRPRSPLPGDVAPDAGGHQWYRGECLCCGIGLGVALPNCAAQLLAETAVEIEVAVVCVDCQAEFNHGPGRCGRGIRCVVCVSDTTDKCSSCGGEIVLEEPATPPTATCAERPAHWCSIHCPLERATSGLGQRRYHNCNSLGARCSEHCQ